MKINMWIAGALSAGLLALAASAASADTVSFRMPDDKSGKVLTAKLASAKVNGVAVHMNTSKQWVIDIGNGSAVRGVGVVVANTIHRGKCVKPIQFVRVIFKEGTVEVVGTQGACKDQLVDKGELKQCPNAAAGFYVAWTGGDPAAADALCKVPTLATDNKKS